MSATDSLTFSREALGYARKRLDYLNGEIARLYGNEPCTMFQETDFETGDIYHRAKLKVPLPAEFTFIALDIINHCRSALDRTGYAMAVASGKTNPRHTHFPFGDTEAEVRSRQDVGSKDIPDEIFAFMAALKPYDGGNDLLWAMNKAWNADKHRMLAPQILNASGLRFSDLQGVMKGFAIPVPPTGWDPVNNSLTFLITTPEHKAQYKVNFSIEITFGEVAGLNGAPFIPALDEMISITEGILGGIEAEARRINLIT